MSISIKYEPGNGVLYNHIFLHWKMDRHLIRNKLQGQFEAQDLEFNGIISRRDIYRELGGQEVLIFFNYNSDDLFSELEIHDGAKLGIDDKYIDIGQPFWEAVDSFGKLSIVQKNIDEAEVLFVDLKLSICSDWSLDKEANGDLLTYIYCSDNIEHLLS